jgi:type I restriction enzyme S subunit
MICSRNGSRKLIGKNGRVTAELAGATFGAFNTIFRSEANTFLYWVLNSSLFDFHLGSYLTSTINQLTISNLNSIVVPLPPPDEQKEISKVLEVKIAELDRLASMAHSAITHLTEYRTALITAATTGKIDVRNVKVPSPTRP